MYTLEKKKGLNYFYDTTSSSRAVYRPSPGCVHGSSTRSSVQKIKIIKAFSLF